MICVAALCHSRSSPLLKLNTAMTYKIGTKALSAILDAMKLIRSPPVDFVQNIILMTILTSRSQRQMACPVHPSRCLFEFGKVLLIARILHMLSCISSTLLRRHLLSLLIIYVKMSCPSIFCTYSMCRHTMFFQSNVVLS